MILYHRNGVAIITVNIGKHIFTGIKINVLKYCFVDWCGNIVLVLKICYYGDFFHILTHSSVILVQ